MLAARDPGGARGERDRRAGRRPGADLPRRAPGHLLARHPDPAPGRDVPGGGAARARSRCAATSQRTSPGSRSARCPTASCPTCRRCWPAAWPGWEGGADGRARPVGTWPVGAAAAAVVGPDGTVLEAYGQQDKVFPLASVTKPLVALSVLVAVEEGALGLDDPAGPPGSTVRHLLATPPGSRRTTDIAVAKPGTRRIYSNAGFDVLGDHLAAVDRHRLRGLPAPGALRAARPDRDRAGRPAAPGRRVQRRRPRRWSRPSC